MLFALASHSLHVGELEHITLGGGEEGKSSKGEWLHRQVYKSGAEQGRRRGQTS